MLFLNVMVSPEGVTLSSSPHENRPVAQKLIDLLIADVDAVSVGSPNALKPHDIGFAVRIRVHGQTKIIFDVV